MKAALHKAKFDKQLGFLLTNLRHSSLRAKKYDEAQNITYQILAIIPHPK